MDKSGAGHGSPSQPQPATGAEASTDRISSLPDDLLLHVLSHLGNPGAAARKTLLSRRWRGLFSQLPSVDVTVHDVPLGSLEDKLRRGTRPGVRLLDIVVPEQDLTTTVSPEQRFSPWPWQLLFALAQDVHPGPCGTLSSVLREAARLSPVQFRLTVPSNLTISPGDRDGSVDLPCFQRATSIDLRAPPHIPLTHSRASTGFPLLENLSLSGCHIDLAALIPRCPRLRELTVDAGMSGDVDLNIQSSLLQGLIVDRTSMPTRCIVVQAPVLKRLTMSLKASREFSVSIVAPIVEKVSWRCSYTSVYHGLGFWRLLDVSLETAEGHGWWAGCSSKSNADTGEDACSPLTRVNVLSLRMSSSMGFLEFPDGEIRFTAEISKHLVTDFSGLELHLATRGHAIGSFVWRLLGMHHHISTATRSLRIVMLRSEVIVACGPNCRCDEPSDWILQRVSLPRLEKLEIEGFEGEDGEFDFLRLVFRCAPMLTRVTVRLPDHVTPNDDWCTKLHDIFAAYPSVEGNIDLIIPGNLAGSVSWHDDLMMPVQ